MKNIPTAQNMSACPICVQEEKLANQILPHFSQYSAISIPVP